MPYDQSSEIDFQLPGNLTDDSIVFGHCTVARKQSLIFGCVF